MKATQSTFLGLEITKTRRRFAVKNSADLVKCLLNLCKLENSKPTAALDREGARVSNSSGWS